MIVCNIKLNKKLIFKSILSIMFIIVVTLLIVCGYMLFVQRSNNEITKTSDDIPKSEIAEISEENYTNILQSVHKNIDIYVGQKISFTGYVYRATGFTENQFVLARDMDIGKNQTLIVGFLCDYDKAKDLKEKSWINITGEITKGNYNGSTIPIIKILSIKNTNKPKIPNVPVPDDEYVPTAVIY